MSELVYKRLKDIIILILSIAFFAMLIKSCNQSEKGNQDKVFIEALSSDLIKERNDKNEEIAKNQIIQTERIKDFVNLKISDSTIARLQKEVKENEKLLKEIGSSVTYLSNLTKFLGKTNTIVNDSLKTYSFAIKDEWIDLNGVADSTNTSIDLKIKNQYSVTIGSERVKVPGKFFKQRRPYTIVKNYNPYTETQELKSYQVTIPKPKKFGIGFSTGLGINSEFKPIYYMGIGVNYTFIRF